LCAKGWSVSLKQLVGVVVVEGDAEIEMEEEGGR